MKSTVVCIVFGVTCLGSLVGGCQDEAFRRWTREHLGLDRLDDVTSLAVGDGNSCVTLESGEVACWGCFMWSGNRCVEGPKPPTTTPLECMWVHRPMLIPGLEDVVEISGTHYHKCGRTRGGEVYCWGSNKFGGLFLDGRTGSEVLEEYEKNRSDADKARFAAGVVPIALDQPATAIAAGAFVSCAAHAGGRVTCWGNHFSQEGKPSTFQLPSSVADLEMRLGEVCAVLDNGELWCWWGDDKQPTKEVLPGPVSRVGVGEPFRYAVLKDGRLFVRNNITNNNVPWEEVMSDVVQADFAQGSGCAVKRDASLWCWGISLDNRLGQGKPTKNEQPDDVIEVRLGLATHCALLKTGEVRCWGSESGHGGGYVDIDREESSERKKVQYVVAPAEIDDPAFQPQPRPDEPAPKAQP